MIISASNARAQLFPLIQQVNEDQAPITITSNNGNAVLVSESEWESILETSFLLRTASNRSHLERSIAALALNKGVKKAYAKGSTLVQLLEISGAAPVSAARPKRKLVQAKPAVRAKKKAVAIKPAAKKRTAR